LWTKGGVFDGIAFFMRVKTGDASGDVAGLRLTPEKSYDNFIFYPIGYTK